MKKNILTFILATVSFSMFGQSIMVFSKTNGYRHKSIETGIRTLDTLAGELGCAIAFSEDSLDISEARLDTVDVLIFLSTSGDVLNDNQQTAVENFINQGKAFIGIHGASATEYDWEWYGGLVGRFFVDHPKVQEATLHIEKHTPLTEDLPDSMVTTDEWYNFETPFPESLNILMTLDESSYEGGKMGNYHPITWCHEYGGGRSFYTALGHTDEIYQNENFRNLIKQAIKWAIGQ